MHLWNPRLASKRDQRGLRASSRASVSMLGFGDSSLRGVRRTPVIEGSEGQTDYTNARRQSQGNKVEP